MAVLFFFSFYFYFINSAKFNCMEWWFFLV